MTDQSTAPAPPTSPLCPIHFPDAAYLGELVPFFYLGRLTQDRVVDHLERAHEGVAGRYAVFVEDGGCGQLLAFLPGVPSPYPLTAAQVAEIEDVYARQDRGESAELSAETETASDAELTWFDHAQRWQLLLTPERGHALVERCRQDGYDPAADHPLAQLGAWLYDRAGRLVQAAE